jgi:hypothetical protein
MKKKLFLFGIFIFLFSLTAINASATTCGSQTITVQPSACNGEYVDVTVSGRYYMDTDEAVWCGANFGVVEIDVYLYESDWSSFDDLIDYHTGYYQAVESPMFCDYVDYSHTFNVRLSDFAGGLEGSTIEIYGEFEPINGPYTGDCSTLEQNVDIISGQCGGGVCCDLSTCNYESSSNICANNVQTDYGCPWGTSPGDDVGVQHADRYCSGTSSSCSGSLQWDSWTQQDNCNSNEMCIDNNPTCQNVQCNSNPDCGTTGWINSPYCSGDDVYQTYRTYTCSNPGTPGSSCSYDDNQQFKEACTTCSGGACVVECDIDSDCGTGSWWINNYYCNSGDVYNTMRSHKCYNPGTLGSFCGYSDNDQFYTTCPNGCSGGECTIECSNNADCGTDSFIGSEYCNGDDVWDYYRTYNCDDPGTIYSSCDYSDNPQSKQTCPNTCLGGVCTDIACNNNADCGTDGFIGNEYCSGNDVNDTYRTYTCTDPGQPSASCSFSDVDQTKEPCTYGCGGGSCQIPACFNDTECGTSGWLDNPYCNTDDVWDTFRNYTCQNPGILSAVCNYSDEDKYKTGCVNGCNNSKCVIPCSVYEDFEGTGMPDEFDNWGGSPDFDSTNYSKSGTKSLEMNDATLNYPQANTATPYFLETWMLMPEPSPPAIPGGIILADEFGGAEKNSFSFIDYTTPSLKFEVDLIDGNSQTTVFLDSDVWYKFKFLIDPINGLGSWWIYDESESIVSSDTDVSISSWSGGEFLEGSPLGIYNYYLDDFHVCNTACITDSHCGTDSWINEPYCSGDEVWQTYKYNWVCNNASTIYASCSYSEEDQLKEDCTASGDVCDNGTCITPVCYTNSDCGTDEWVGNSYCNIGDEWNIWREYTCNNPGAVDSSCSYTDSDQLKDTCLNGCVNDSCVIECYTNSDCGADEWLDNPYCNGTTEVWDTYRNYICQNQGAGSSSCSYTDNNQSKDTCLGYCANGSCKDSYLWNADYDSRKIYKLKLDGTIVDSFDISGTYPTGLTWDGRYLWHTDRNADKIFKLTVYGVVADSFDSPGFSPAGLAWDGTYLWNIDDGDDKIYKLTTDGSIVDSFDSTTSNDQEGLAWDGTYLWLVDDDSVLLSNRIYKLTTDGNVESDFLSPGYMPKGLTYDGEYLWNADRTDQKIYKITKSGSIIDSFDSPSSNPTGLAFQPGTPSCYSDSDCGVNGFINNEYCSGDDIWDLYRNYTCNNPGTESSYCSFSDSIELKQDCGTDGWIGNEFCSVDDIWQTYRSYSCASNSSGAYCYNSDNDQLKQSCDYGCVNDSCVNPDLSVKYFLKQGPANPAAGQDVVLAFMLENIGQGFAENIDWQIDWDDSNTVNGVVSRLDSGQQSSITMRKHPYSSAGTYNPILTVDYLNNINESDEGNNDKTMSIDIS